MPIIITGATGQVGGALVKRLGRAAVGLSRRELDLTQLDTLGKTLDRLAPEIIINPAGYTAVDRAEDEEQLAFRVNSEAPGVMARWAADHQVPLVHFSTDYVFDGVATKPWREDDKPNPLSVYGASKLAGEQAIRSAGGIHLIVRTSWIYASAGNNFLRTIVRLGRERNELRIVADQFGAPSSAGLIADVVAAIVERPRHALDELFGTSRGLVHVAASGHTTWYGFAVAIVEGLRSRGVKLAIASIVPITTAEYPSKAKRPANSKLDLSRLREVFGITTPEWRVALSPELDQLARELD